MAKIQIGWLSEAIEDEDDLYDCLASSEIFGPEVAPVSDYNADTVLA